MSTGKILVVDDEADIRGLLKEILSDEGYDVDVAANAGQARASRARRPRPTWCCSTSGCPTPTASRCCANGRAAGSDDCPVVMMSGHGTVETAVEATRLGAFDFVEKPLSLAKLLRTVERAHGRRQDSAAFHGAPQLRAAAGHLRQSRVTQQLRDELTRVAAARRPLLLVGEAGSGREALARFTHEAGPRAARPFVSLVASAVPDEHAERFLFGRVQTAARRRACSTRRGAARCSSRRSRTSRRACSACCSA